MTSPFSCYPKIAIDKRKLFFSEYVFLRDEQRKLQEKLKAVESKLIVGGVNLVSVFFILKYDHFANIFSRVK